MKEEIISGLKNATQRGTPIEIAMQSFINAGYSETDVKEAAESLSIGLGGVSEIIRVNTPKNKEINNRSNLPELPKAEENKKLLVIVLVIIGFIILGVGGYLFYYFNKV